MRAIDWKPSPEERAEGVTVHLGGSGEASAKLSQGIIIGFSGPFSVRSTKKHTTSYNQPTVVGVFVAQSSIICFQLALNEPAGKRRQLANSKKDLFFDMVLN